MRRIVPFVVVLFLFACQSGSPRPKNNTPDAEKLPTLFRLSTSPGGPMINQGDTLVLLVEIVDPSYEIVEWNWTVNGLPTAGSETGLLWFSTGRKLGKYTFTLTGKTADGRTLSKTIIRELAAASTPEQYTYELVRTLPHDPNAYTQGFCLHNGVFYEGTGLKGKSSLREVEVVTGNILRSYNIPTRFFGEGITVKDGKLYQLTWQGKTGFVYDLETFRPLKEFTYNTEGWGLTHNDTALFISDGSHRIYALDLKTLTETGTIEVYNEQARMINLNELEWINGEIWANIYGTDYICRINPKTGAVTGMIDFTQIFNSSTYPHRIDVFNGIAYDDQTETVYVTGKLWPHVFEVRIVPSGT